MECGNSSFLFSDKNGGANGTRTRDSHAASVVLSQLSYSPTVRQISVKEIILSTNFFEGTADTRRKSQIIKIHN